MDENEGHGGGSHNKHFNLNSFTEEKNDDHGERRNVGEEEFTSVGSNEVHHDVTSSGGRRLRQPASIVDAAEFARSIINREVENQRNRLRSLSNANLIGITGHIGSSSHGTTPYRRNVSAQGVDGTRTLLHTASSQPETSSQPVLQPPSSRPVLQSPRSRLMLQSAGSRPVLQSARYTSYSRSPVNQILDDPTEVLRNMNLPRYANSSFFIPRGVHEHNMRIQSTPDMFGRYVLHRQGPPAVQMVPPMVDMRPLMVIRPPRVEMPPPLVQMVPPMVEMRPPMVQMGSHRAFLNDPTRPAMEPSYSDEATSQYRRQHDDEQESTSRDAKRLKR